MIEVIAVPAGANLREIGLSLAGREVYVHGAEAGDARVIALNLEPHYFQSGSLPDGVILLLFPSYTEELIQVVDRLLGPGGCPWDQAQTHASLRKYLIEEAYEVLEAIDDGNSDLLKEELGDLLLQPVMHGQMANRDGIFSTEDVAKGIVDKLIRRHPHVFGNVIADDTEEVLRNWDKIKQAEKGNQIASILGNIPKGMPSLLRAHEVSKRAARCGFEWPDLEGVFAKLEEEKHELREAISGGDGAEIESEIGDILFTVVNLARWLKVDPEEALRHMVTRFVKRFQTMESITQIPLAELSPAAWEGLWQRAKLTTQFDSVSQP